VIYKKNYVTVLSTAVISTTEATYKSQLLYFNHTRAHFHCTLELHVSLPLRSSSIQGHPNSAFPCK